MAFPWVAAAIIGSTLASLYSSHRQYELQKDAARKQEAAIRKQEEAAERKGPDPTKASTDYGILQNLHDRDNALRGYASAFGDSDYWRGGNMFQLVNWLNNLDMNNDDDMTLGG